MIKLFDEVDEKDLSQKEQEVEFKKRISENINPFGYLDITTKLKELAANKRNYIPENRDRLGNRINLRMELFHLYLF